MIGFIGLSHLGINSSLAVAARGFEVVGFDPRLSLTQELNQGLFPIYEPGLKELFEEHREKIQFSSNREVLKQCDLIYISIDVPTDTHNQSDIRVVESLVWDYIEILSPETILVVLSQVPPGFSRPLWKRLKEKQIHYFYQVETLVFGCAIERALHPERYIVGCADPKLALPKNYRELLEAFNCPILTMQFESAELTKIAINFYLTSAVSVTNTLAEICENVGAEWSEIIPALKYDKRIGPYAYLKPGLGLAGGNLERDLVTIQKVSQDYGTESSIVKSWFLNSEYRRDWVLRILYKQVLVKTLAPKIALWGLAYKIGTHSLKNAPSLSLLEALHGLSIQAYDPEARMPVHLTSSTCFQVGTPLEACESADVLIIFTPYEELKSFDPDKLKEKMQGRVIIDPYGVLNSERFCEQNFHYFTLGAKT